MKSAIWSARCARVATMAMAGRFTLAKITAGQYWIAVSRPVHIELMQNYVWLDLHEREGDTPAFEVQLDAGSMLLQVWSISDAPPSIAIWPRPGT